MDREIIKQVFGLKIRQIRDKKKLSLSSLAAMTGLSKSYLNEIERGKKYPKLDKIMLLSNHLDIAYEELVSLKLDKKYGPIGHLIQSQILSKIPFHIFGLKERNIIDLLVNEPLKGSAFVQWVGKMAKNQQINFHDFLMEILRLRREQQHNFFADIEQEVIEFSHLHAINLSVYHFSADFLALLTQKFGYDIHEDGLVGHDDLKNFDSLTVLPSKKLLLQRQLSEHQRHLIFAQELGYAHLNINERPCTNPALPLDDYTLLSNAFRSTYFASALILPYEKLVNAFRQLFQQETFNALLFDEIVGSFNASPGMFYRRLNQVLPHAFSLKGAFYLHINGGGTDQLFHLEESLFSNDKFLSNALIPNEHLCQRWVAIKVLQDSSKRKVKHEFDIQISEHPSEGKSYLILSSATKHESKDEMYSSFSMGFLITEQLRQKVRFIEDPKIRRQVVGVTCEQCPIHDCMERRVPATALLQSREKQRIEDAVQAINKALQ